MSEITLPEVIELKESLEKSIADAINEFAKKTGLNVDGVSLAHLSDSRSGKVIATLVSIEVKV